MRRIFERTAITQHTLASIAKDATGGGPLDISEGDKEKFQTGLLREVMVLCPGSTDFDVRIGQKCKFVAGGADEIYSAANETSGRHQITTLRRGWISGDDPKSSNLYLTIFNDDAANATGEITVRLTNNINKRFSK